MKTIPQCVDTVYKRYQAIPVPYYISPHGKSLASNIFKGKGSIESIEKTLEHLIQKHPSEKPSDLLRREGIGIDCSGFISYLLDAYTLTTFQKHIWAYYVRPTMNPLNMVMFRLQPLVSMLNANTLTSRRNTIIIARVSDAQPMDLIRLSGGKHVAMIYEMFYENDILKEITYIHSTDMQGVCKGKIMITDPDTSIISQEWLLLGGETRHEPSELIRQHINENGVRRPHFLT